MSNNNPKNSDEDNPVFNKLMESLENQKRKREEEERKKKTTIILKRKKKSKVTGNVFLSPEKNTELHAVHINTDNKPSSSRKLFNKMKSKINDINNNINELKLKRMESDEKFTPEEKRILYDLLIDSENQLDNIACDLDKFEFNTEFLDNEYDNLTEDTKKQMQGNPVPPKDNIPVYFKHKIKF